MLGVAEQRVDLGRHRLRRQQSRRLARLLEQFAVVREDLGALRAVPMGDRVWQRALNVFELLAERGPMHHRQIGIADLLIAAAAELAELPLLHYDHHFEVVAELTGQPVEALAPLGSL